MKPTSKEVTHLRRKLSHLESTEVDDRRSSATSSLTRIAVGVPALEMCISTPQTSHWAFQ
ncbi:hypothetical protein HMPREF9061_00680 [Actinomyces sp. oral taxon 181 str. F0379]|nr:hypothetical protein HMPREF9061_00680 [Actinomyces sp. oral taxon 181 str. F0379]